MYVHRLLFKKLDTFSVHLSVKSHVTIVKCTDFSSIIYLESFSVHLSVKSHVTIVKYTDLVQSYTVSTL